MLLASLGARRVGLAVAGRALALGRHPQLLARVDEGAAEPVQLAQLPGRRVEARRHRRQRIPVAHLQQPRYRDGLVEKPFFFYIPIHGRFFSGLIKLSRLMGELCAVVGAFSRGQ